jgi:hypothetical protein
MGETHHQLAWLGSAVLALLAAACAHTPEEKPPAIVQVPGAAETAEEEPDEALPAAQPEPAPPRAPRLSCGSRARLSGSADPDRGQLRRALLHSLRALERSAVRRRWADERQPAVTVLPIFDPTDERFTSKFGALTPQIEGLLVLGGQVRVVSSYGLPLPAEVVGRDAPSSVDISRAAQWASQLGARYVVVVDLCQGEIDPDAPSALVMHVLDCETGDVLFEKEVLVGVGQGQQP